MKRNAARTTILCILLVAAAAAVGWAARTVLTPARDPLAATQFTTARVVQGEVGASLNLMTVTEWEPTPVGANHATGIVTGVTINPGDEAKPGDVLYSVNQRPVVIAEGDVPAYRDLSSEETGADIEQWQRMLTATGFYSGDITGNMLSATIDATRKWQKSVGLPDTGVVNLGDVIFVPHLPTRVSLDTEKIARDLQVAGGEPVVRALPSTPVFSIPATSLQAQMMPVGTKVEITTPSGGTWNAVTGSQTPDREAPSTINVALEPVTGESICGSECGQVPVTGQSTLSTRIITVPTVQGLVVPSAALITDAQGQLAVIRDTGERIPVKVLAAANGQSVVEGVDEGTVVRVPATERPNEQDGGQGGQQNAPPPPPPPPPAPAPAEQGGQDAGPAEQQQGDGQSDTGDSGNADGPGDSGDNSGNPDNQDGTQ